MTDQKPIRILYMEDNLEVASLVKARLLESGYQVDHALDGEQGLAMYDSGSYDIIAVDQHMPVRDGLSVLQTLAARGPLPPTIMVTGTGNETIAVEAMKLGASDYLVKDVDGGYLKLLPSVIQQVLQQQQLVKENRQVLATLQQRNRDLALLNQAGRAFTTILNLQQLTHLLLQTATQLVGARGGSIWLWDEDEPGYLICQMVFNQGEHRSPMNLHLKPGEGIAGWVALHEESIIVPHAQNNPRFSPKIDAQTGFRTTSLIAVPLHGREGLIGVLEVVNKLEGSFNANDLTLAQALSTPAAIAIDNARMVDDLRRHAVELQERNEELDAFSHTVAHDLKAPLVNIVGYAEVLRDNYSGLPPQETENYLHIIARAGRKMSNLIDELLLLAGVRQLNVPPQPLAMEQIIADVLERLDYLLQETPTKIITPSAWPIALGHAPWVEEIWANYLSNAIKYGRAPCRIELGGAEQADGTVRFWVKDNGPGLSQDEQKRLFIPFTRLSQIRVQGHGLGLSIVRRIAEKLKGQAGVESVPGEGSTFYFILPGYSQ
ncbi:MAG TPA: response regulator [Chloroflexi bacterium]|nr:response regulator [Chloroflexota bacterium]